MSSFYSKEELKEIGFRTIGEDVLISRKASIYGAKDISIGDHVRIDDFCILSGNIILGSYIHIAAYCALFGGKSGIVMNDFSGLSSRCVIYADSDDYSGEYLTNPTVSDEFRHVTGGKVVLGRHVIVGTGSSIMPNIIIEEGAAVGSMSLVNASLKGWAIYAGIPCRKIKDRNNKLLDKESEFLISQGERPV